MSLFHRGMKSILRNLDKTFLLFLILFILGNLIAGAMAIRQASLNVENRIKQSLGSVVRVDSDEELYRQLFEQSDPEKAITHEIVSPSGESSQTVIKMDVEQLPSLSVEDITTIAQSNRVKSYDYNTNLIMGSPHLLSVNNPLPTSEEENLFGLQLSGTQHTPVMEIQEGSAELIEGRVFTPEEIEQGRSVCLISKELADYNQVKVGDKIV